MKKVFEVHVVSPRELATKIEFENAKRIGGESESTIFLAVAENISQIVDMFEGKEIEEITLTNYPVVLPLGNLES
jgi:hypothetical protein